MLITVRINQFSSLPVTFIGIILFLGLAHHASAQVLSDQRRSTTQIQISRQAQNLITSAMAKRENGDLEGFINNLQNARENFQNRLVSVRNVEGLYVGVQHRTNELLLSLDKKGRTIYRKKFEKRAEDALRSAITKEDFDRIFNVAERYPLTASAQDALEHLGIQHFKKGAFQKALSVYQHLYRLLLEGDRNVRAAQKIAYCHAQLGQVTALKKFISQLSEKQRETIIRPDAGRTLSAYVKQQITRAKRHRTNKEETVSNRQNWSPDQIATTSPSVQLNNGKSNHLNPKIVFSIPPGASRVFRHNKIRRTRHGIQEVNALYPMIVDGHIILNNGVSCWAWDLPADRQPLQNPSWTLSGSDIDGSRIMKDVRLLFRGSSSSDGNYYCSLVTDLGKSETQMIKLQVRFPIPWRSLFSIDVSEGTINWKRGGPSDDGFAENASFPSGATHRDGVLYAPAVKFQTSKDTPNMYGTAIDASSGEVLWNTFLTKNMLGTNLFENPIREVVPATPMVDEQNVYLNTNTGIIVALNRATGTIKWLYRYMQWRFPDTESIYPKRQTTFWQNNLPLQMENTLLFTPTDSIRMIAMDRETGRVKWKKEQPRLHNILNGFAKWIVPMRNNRILVTSKNGMIMLSASDGKQVSEDEFTPSTPIEGRPTVLDDYIALPTQRGIDLIKYEKAKGQIKFQFSKEGTLTSQNFYKPGNVFFQGNHILMTSQDQFSYFRLISN